MKGPAADPKRLGVFIPTGDQFTAERLAFQLATMLQLTTHDGRKYCWPPRSQRENSAGLHQLRIETNDHGHFAGICSCGFGEGSDCFTPDSAFADWQRHLIAEGVL